VKSNDGSSVTTKQAGSPSVTDKSDSSTDKTTTAEAIRLEIEAAPDAQQRAVLRLKLSDLLASSGKKQEAIAELRSLAGEDRFDPLTLYNAGNALARLRDADSAVNAYRKANDQGKGRYSRALNNLGVVLMRQTRWEEAAEAFLAALRLEDFRYAEASYNLGRLYYLRGERDLAVREWRRALAVNPEHTAAAQALARAGNEGRITVAARTPLTKPIPNKTDNGSMSKTPTVARRAPPVSNNPSRKSISTRTLLVDPETFGFLQRARSARDNGHNEEAIANYDRVISRMGGYFAPANLELSYALMTLKRNDVAIKTLLEVSKVDGERYPITYYYLGRLYEVGGELPLALQNYRRALELSGENGSQFLLDVSRTEEKLGNFKGAVASMEEYVGRAERQGRKPDWSDERLSALRKKVTESANKSKP